MPKTKTNKKLKSPNKPKPQINKAKANEEKPFLALFFEKKSKKPKEINQDRSELNNSFKIFWRGVVNLWDHWPQFGIILMVYMALSVILVRGFSSSNNVSQLKNLVSSIFHGSTAAVSTSASVFSLLLNSAGNTSSPAPDTYQTILFIIFSLVIIWSLRTIIAGKKLKISDAFYKSIYPLIPFFLIIILIAVELIPLLIGVFVYDQVMSNHLSVNLFQNILWLLILLVSMIISFYWLSSSVFAFYIVTLPNMRPMESLRSAKKLVKFRRWSIIRKIIFLPICLLVVGGIILIPIILLDATIADWAFFVLISASLFIAHSYMYTLYRELL